MNFKKVNKKFFFESLKKIKKNPNDSKISLEKILKKILKKNTNLLKIFKFFFKKNFKSFKNLNLFKEKKINIIKKKNNRKMLKRGDEIIFLSGKRKNMSFKILKNFINKDFVFLDELGKKKKSGKFNFLKIKKSNIKKI